MYELHQKEQYFFDEQTLDQLSDFLGTWPSVGCLCAPLLGKRLAKRSVNVTILDIDQRFETVPGFHYYDLYRPERLATEFAVIVCDPPFFNVSLSQLFAAVRVLSHYRFDQPLLITYLQRRAAAIRSSSRNGLSMANWVRPRRPVVMPKTTFKANREVAPVQLANALTAILQRYLPLEFEHTHISPNEAWQI